MMAIKYMLTILGLLMREGVVDNVKAEPDPSVVAVYVTAKFVRLPLDGEAMRMNALCNEISIASQRDAGTDEAVGVCDIVLSGSENVIGHTMFSERGEPATAWEMSYLRARGVR